MFATNKYLTNMFVKPSPNTSMEAVLSGTAWRDAGRNSREHQGERGASSVLLETGKRKSAPSGCRNRWGGTEWIKGGALRFAVESTHLRYW